MHENNYKKNLELLKKKKPVLIKKKKLQFFLFNKFKLNFYKYALRVFKNLIRAEIKAVNFINFKKFKNNFFTLNFLPYIMNFSKKNLLLKKKNYFYLKKKLLTPGKKKN
jgi:hypothetical protein